MEEPAWRALSATAQALYPWLLLEWRGPRANNNGRISLGVREAADKLGVGRDTAARAFHDLQSKGFVVVTEAARLGCTGDAKGSRLELTEIALPHAREGRKLYRKWKDGSDFPVLKASQNNPKGLNGKTKPHHQNHDGAVIKLMTNLGGTS